MNTTSEGGLSFGGLLTLVFIVLKLCKVISWSWLWVLCPLWIPLAIAILWFGGIYLAMKLSKK